MKIRDCNYRRYWKHIRGEIWNRKCSAANTEHGTCRFEAL